MIGLVPKITVVSVKNKEELIAAVKNSDMVFVTKLSAANLNAMARTLDEEFDGAIAELAATLDPHFGSYRLIHLPSQKMTFGRVQYVYVLGLGRAEEFTGHSLCSFYGFVLHQAQLCGAHKVTLLESPRRMTAQSLNLQGTANIMRCRGFEFAKRCLPDREIEVQILCAPQAKRFLESGLQLDAGVHCVPCTFPQAGGEKTEPCGPFRPRLELPLA